MNVREGKQPQPSPANPASWFWDLGVLVKFDLALSLPSSMNQVDD